MKCEICNGEMEHINDIGLRCMNCDLDNETTEVYVVVNMWSGLVEDVSVHRDEPKGLEPIDEDGDNGNFIFHTEIKDKYSD